MNNSAAKRQRQQHRKNPHDFHDSRGSFRKFAVIRKATTIQTPSISRSMAADASTVREI